MVKHWDPIGINDEPACWDEYDSYIGGVLKLLVENGSDKDLAEYLRRIARERMGLAPDEDAIADTLKALREIPLKKDTRAEAKLTLRGGVTRMGRLSGVRETKQSGRPLRRAVTSLSPVKTGPIQR